MCGIAGLYCPGQAPDGLRASIGAMTDALAHRGPDGAGQWLDEAAGLALGHRRLAILDLSEAGYQPMLSAFGRYVLCFNGEIYNFRELRAALDQEHDHPWCGHSDSEVLLEAFARWGWEATLGRLTGMFAIALYDRKTRRLWLARDRLGEKPLYLAWLPERQGIAFASELKGLSALPGWRSGARLDRSAAASFLRLGYVPAPQAIWQGVEKLRPGAWLCLGPDDGAIKDLQRGFYWDARVQAEEAAAAPVILSVEQAEAELEARLLRAVSLRLESDVPLGAFLSGGIDSSTVVALMAALARRQGRDPSTVHSFAIGFDDPRYDEAPHAKAVAQHLGTTHTEYYVSQNDALALVPSLPERYDEPFADPSALPTLLLCRLTRQAVSVALSGDGGDELFAGYHRQWAAVTRWQKANRLPKTLRTLLGGLGRRLDGSTLDALSARFARRPPRLGEKLLKSLDFWGATTPEQVARRFASLWPRPECLLPGAEEAPGPLDDPDRHATLADPLLRMLYLDALGYLPDDLQVKIDRASMAVGLEARAPLLDHDLVHFAWRLPSALKHREGSGKWLLKRVLARHVPPALFERPKQGFEPPLAGWLRGPLRDWGEDLLSTQTLLAPKSLRACWQEHQAEQRDWSARLWAVLILLAWARQNAT